MQKTRSAKTEAEVEELSELLQLQEAALWENQMLKDKMKNMAHQCIHSGRANQGLAASNQQSSLFVPTQTTGTAKDLARNKEFMGDVEAALKSLIRVSEDSEARDGGSAVDFWVTFKGFYDSASATQSKDYMRASSEPTTNDLNAEDELQLPPWVSDLALRSENQEEQHADAGARVPNHGRSKNINGSTRAKRRRDRIGAPALHP